MNCRPCPPCLATILNETGGHRGLQDSRLPMANRHETASRRQRGAGPCGDFSHLLILPAPGQVPALFLANAPSPLHPEPRRPHDQIRVIMMARIVVESMLTSDKSTLPRFAASAIPVRKTPASHHCRNRPQIVGQCPNRSGDSRRSEPPRDAPKYAPRFAEYRLYSSAGTWEATESDGRFGGRWMPRCGSGSPNRFIELDRLRGVAPPASVNRRPRGRQPLLLSGRI